MCFRWRSGSTAAVAQVRRLIRTAKRKYPQLAEHAIQLDTGKLGLAAEVEELEELAEEVMEGASSRLPAWLRARLPATPPPPPPSDAALCRGRPKSVAQDLQSSGWTGALLALTAALAVPRVEGGPARPAPPRPAPPRRAQQGEAAASRSACNAAFLRYLEATTCGGEGAARGCVLGIAVGQADRAAGDGSGGHRCNRGTSGRGGGRREPRGHHPGPVSEHAGGHRPEAPRSARHCTGRPFWTMLPPLCMRFNPVLWATPAFRPASTRLLRVDDDSAGMACALGVRRRLSGAAARRTDPERRPPPPPQVASQQGKYLAGVFNSHRMLPAPPPDQELDAAVEPFDYRHLGAFAYVGGDNAVLELPTGGPPPRLRRPTTILWNCSREQSVDIIHTMSQDRAVADPAHWRIWPGQ